MLIPGSFLIGLGLIRGGLDFGGFDEILVEDDFMPVLPGFQRLHDHLVFLLGLQVIADFLMDLLGQVHDTAGDIPQVMQDVDAVAAHHGIGGVAGRR